MEGPRYLREGNEIKVQMVGGNGGLPPDKIKEGYENLQKAAQLEGVELHNTHFYPVKTEGKQTVYEFSGEVNKKK